jgi:hypothetical protein
LKERLSQESREMLEALVKETVLEVLRDIQKLPAVVEMYLRDSKRETPLPIRNPNLSPETMILTEQDFRLLRGLKISSKGMLLGENSHG